MRAWVIVLVGCGRIGFDPGSSPPPPDDAVTTFTGPHADPTLLPLATGQIEATLSPGQPLTTNQSYIDPISGIRIWKLTDANFPELNTDARVEREIAGAQISASWEDDSHTVAVIVQVAGGGKRYLIDVQRDIGITSTRELVRQGAEDVLAFSSDPLRPQLLYAGDGSSRLHQIDTATNTQVDASPFPLGDVYSLPSVSAGGRVVVAQSRNTGFVAVNTTTSQVSTFPTGGNEIPAVDHGGAYILQAKSGPGELWRIGAVSTVPWLPPSGDFQASVGVTGGFVAVDVDTGGDMSFYFSDPDTLQHTRFGTYGGYDTVFMASQWIQTDVPRDQQWVLYTTTEQGFIGGPLDDAIGFLRLDGELRFLAHHYADDQPSFYKLPRASLSPDGRMVVFSSTMGPDGGRSDVYVAEVPLSP